MNKDQLIKEGMEEIRGCQKDYDTQIKHAPMRSSYNKFTGGYTSTKSQLRREKINCIKDICENYSIFGIELLSAKVLQGLEV